MCKYFTIPLDTMYIESLNQIKVSNATWRGRFSGRDYKEIGSVWDTLSSLPAPFGKGTSNRANNIPWGISYHISAREFGVKMSNNFDAYNRKRSWDV